MAPPDSALAALNSPISAAIIGAGVTHHDCPTAARAVALLRYPRRRPPPVAPAAREGVDERELPGQGQGPATDDTSCF